jgi:DsbC/DsbD-like thiol-disulfide interchange protein
LFAKRFCPLRPAIRFLLILLALLVAPLAATATPVDAGHVTVDLVAQDAGAVPGAMVYVALREMIDPGWHTYWRNPGDSGEPTRIAWTLPAGWRAGDIVWPAPERISTGPADNPIINYVFSGDLMLPVPISIPASATPGQTLSIRANVSYLVCSDICVPEQATVTLFIPVVAQSAGPDPQWGARIAAAIAAAPKRSGLTGAYAPRQGGLQLAITGSLSHPADPPSLADFYAYDGTLLSPPRTPAHRARPRGPDLYLGRAAGGQPGASACDARRCPAPAIGDLRGHRPSRSHPPVDTGSW